MVRVGQGVLGRVRFRDGGYPQYDRTCLVVEVTPQRVGLLNVSSTAGKEAKLLFSTNRRISRFNPPFLKDSFVKLDSLVYIDHAAASGMRVLCSGQTLDAVELADIIANIR